MVDSAAGPLRAWGDTVAGAYADAVGAARTEITEQPHGLLRQAEAAGEALGRAVWGADAAQRARDAARDVLTSPTQTRPQEQPRTWRDWFNLVGAGEGN